MTQKTRDQFTYGFKEVGTTVTCDVSGGSGLATSQVTFTFTSSTGEVGTVKP